MVCQGGIYLNDTNMNTLVGIDSDGIRVHGTDGTQVAQIEANGNITANGGITAFGEIEARGPNGSFVVSDTNGDWSASIDSGGNLSCSNINANGSISAAASVSAMGNITGGTLIAGNQAAGITITTFGHIHFLDNCDITLGGNGQGGLALNGSLTATSFNTSSDRNMKENFAPVNNQEILERVASLPISQWNFKADEQTRHIGPMAQDFFAAFNVGTDDKHIATVDEDGVALAAIQGLNQKLNEKDLEIQALKQSVAELKKLVQSMAKKEMNR
jgi:hypothetical protein